MRPIKEKRFGSIAVEKGFVSSDQVIEALATQAKENIQSGTHRLLGEILVDMGYLTSEQVEDILDTMSQAMMYMIAAGR
jgi:hypothetical protein